MEGQRKPPALFHPQNLRRLFRTVEVELLLVAGFFAHELFAQRRLRGYDEDFLFVVQHFGAAGARAEEVKGTFTAMFQFHQRAHGDGVAVRELARAELLKLGDGGFEFHRLLGLATGEIGGFETARVVFALGLALLVRGLGARGVRGAEINLQLLCEPGDDFFDDGAFVQNEWEKVVWFGNRFCFPPATVFRRSLAVQCTFGFRRNNCVTTSLILTFSPRRRNSASAVLVFRLTVRPIPSLVFPQRRRTILLLLGEKAGMRADVKTNMPRSSLTDTSQ